MALTVEVSHLKVLLVGGGGFIGSYLTKILVTNNVETVVLDNFSSQFQQRSFKGATVIDGDFYNKETLRSAMRGVTHVWHGAYPHNIESRIDDIDTVWGNVKATVRLAKMSRQNKAECFVYASSRSVYGRVQYNPVNEKHPIKPVTTYGLCKAVCEDYLRDLLEGSETRLLVLRGFLVYGPGDKQSVVFKFVKTILKGLQPTIHGDGSATRDYIHVADMAKACELALRHGKAPGTFNVGTGKETSLLQLVDLLIKVADKKDIKPRFVHKDGWNVNDRCFADISLAKRVLGFQPNIELKDGLLDIIEWQRGISNTV